MDSVCASLGEDRITRETTHTYLPEHATQRNAIQRSRVDAWVGVYVFRLILYHNNNYYYNDGGRGGGGDTVDGIYQRSWKNATLAADMGCLSCCLSFFLFLKKPLSSS